MKKSFLHSRLLLILFMTLLIGVLIRLAFPPWFNIGRMPSAGNMSPYELFQTFSENTTRAYTLYAGKVILLEGSVTTVGDNYITMGSDMRIVKCIFRNTIYDRKPELVTGNQVIIKGVCRGMILTEALLTHCVVIKK